ncbi:MAG: endo-1,4-beta-xylanase [Firmicutes bacterium]|nr:endo-1,4-beta-xylanase [Bacillota bacterium]
MKDLQHRKGTATISLGANFANKPVEIKQTRHKFLFGTSEFTVPHYLSGNMPPQQAEIAKRRFDHLVEIFNAVTLPFYWGRYEQEEGKPHFEDTLKGAKWLKERGITLKGHPLCWHTVCADWLMQYPNEKILEIQLNRLKREISAFAGIIDIWDVINETVIMPIFDRYDNAITRICQQYGRIDLVRKLFKVAWETNPNATFLINDFDTSEAYDILIEGLLESGVPIKTIGIQSHMHQGVWEMEKLEEVLHRFSRFNLPIHFTEITLISGDLMPAHIGDLNDFAPKEWPSTEEGLTRQAEQAAAFYTKLYEHPLLESITWWNFNDGLWLNAPAGLVDKESNIKPVYTALHKLIKGDWWTAPQTITADGNGNVSVVGTKGDYLAVCEGNETAFAIN